MEPSEAIFSTLAGVLEATGPDAHTFLQGQFSNDLGQLEIGASVQGLWLNRKGKIVADGAILRLGEDRFWIVCPFVDRAVVEARLSDFLIMDEVELKPVAVGWGGCCLMGLDVHDAARVAGVEAPESGRIVFQDDVVIYWGRRGDARTLEILASERHLRACREHALAAASENRIRVAEGERLATFAIEHLAPRVGVDVGEGDLPQEVGLVDGWVSFSKGCYLGQEVMARLHSMGRARKRLARVKLESEIVETVPCPLFDDAGRKRGELRLVAETSGEILGLAVVSVGYSGRLRPEGSDAFSVLVSEGESPRS